MLVTIRSNCCLVTYVNGSNDKYAEIAGIRELKVNLVERNILNVYEVRGCVNNLYSGLGKGGILLLKSLVTCVYAGCAMKFTEIASKAGERLSHIWFLFGGRMKKYFTLNEQRYVTEIYFRNKLTLNEKHEPWLDSAYQAALKSKEGVFIDVGANTGQTMVKILYLDKEREYIGFEPQLDCSFYIDQFIKQNNLINHSVIPIGLSNQNGILELLKRSENIDCTASTIKGFRPDEFYTDKKIIYVARGDEIISKCGSQEIAIIKIDVEGGELEVIEGLGETLKEHVPFVFFEILNHYLVVTQQEIDPEIIEFRESRNRNLERILRENHYCIFNVLPDNRLLEIAEIKPIVSGDLRITDYVAVHEKYKNRFKENFKGVFE